MKRRRVQLVSVVLALLGIAGLLLVQQMPRSGAGATRENFRRLEVGMSTQAVADLLGCPHGYDTFGEGTEPCHFCDWEGERLTIVVEFGQDGLVTGGNLIDYEGAIEPFPGGGILDRLLRLLHLR
jgi:hypothetical protein